MNTLTTGCQVRAVGELFGGICPEGPKGSVMVFFLGGGANQGELSEGAGGTFGRVTLFDTATHQELLDCTHSKAHNFKKVRE